MTAPLELWAGVECTVNRVGDRFFDQVRRTGHHDRLADLDRLAAMGARAVRYPVLWERTAPDGLACADWTWADERLERLRTLALRPIVGLVHHGGGPASTSLVAADFPEGLGTYARAVAQRYPWVQDFTPVNEPLTTARFSGLYGHWHPHGASSEVFALALVQQCRAIAASMRAIREVTPSARLIQTEDMGTIFSTPGLAHQAAFENERRFLSLDLLCGRVDRSHPMWRYLLDSAVPESFLDELVLAPCPPDVVGLNYYVTSDRFLDERLERHPPSAHGGNGRQRYADVEAVRERDVGIVGHAARLDEAWERYRRPLALTEVHLGCTREEQLRWLDEAWRGALAARERGADVRAVTVWSAFGAMDWDSLLVREGTRYEPGAYDVRGATPRPTAIVALARELSETGRGTHPILVQPGWWRTPRRILGVAETETALGRPIFITGASGTLGREFARACAIRGLAHRSFDRVDMDITSSSAIARAIEEHRPWAIVNAAGYARVDDAELESTRCHRDNVIGPSTLAAACRAAGIALATFSSDLVFDGAGTRPYVESDRVAPHGVFARSKVRAEQRVSDLDPSALVIRTSACFGANAERSFVAGVLSALRRGVPFAAAADRFTSATYLPDLVNATLDLLVDREAGIWHLTNQGAVSFLELAELAANACNLATSSLVACQAADLNLLAPRPRFSALASERSIHMPSLGDALLRHARDHAA